MILFKPKPCYLCQTVVYMKFGTFDKTYSGSLDKIQAYYQVFYGRNRSSCYTLFDDGSGRFYDDGIIGINREYAFWYHIY